MAQLTLAQLLTPATRDQVNQKLLAFLQANSFPVTDWQTGGVEKTIVAAFATGLIDLLGGSTTGGPTTNSVTISNTIATIAGGGFLDYATGNWLTFLAQELYNLTRNPSSGTIATLPLGITLTCNNVAGPYVIAPSQLIFQSTTGNRYFNSNQVGNITLNTNSTAVIPVVSEFQGSIYNDAAGAITIMQTPLAGVTCNNPAPSYTAVAQIGTGSGTLTLGGSPTGSHSVTVRVDTSGQASIATWSTSLDGNSFVSQGGSGFATNLGGFGINITLTNGGGNPSFVAGDTYSFSTPGTWYTTAGTDAESDNSLASRCRARWPQLNSVLQNAPTLSVYDLLARNASTQVVQTYIVPDPTINNQVDIYVAGASGTVSAGVIASVQSYINARVSLTDKPVVQSPSTKTVTLSAATVVVKSSQLAAVQLAIQNAFNSYINGAGINGLIKLATLITIVMNGGALPGGTGGVSGVQDFYGLSITGANSNGVDLQLPITNPVELPQWSQTLYGITPLWTWTTV